MIFEKDSFKRNILTDLFFKVLYVYCREHRVIPFMWSKISITYIKKKKKYFERFSSTWLCSRNYFSLMSSFWRELLQLIGLWFMHPYFYKWSVMWCLDKLTLFFYTFLVCLLNWMLMSWAQLQHLCQLVNFSSVAIIVELSFTQI